MVDKTFLGTNRRAVARRLAFRVRPHRLAVRTPAFHAGNTGSIPVGVTEAQSAQQRALGLFAFDGKTLR